MTIGSQWPILWTNLTYLPIVLAVNLPFIPPTPEQERSKPGGLVIPALKASPQPLTGADTLRVGARTFAMSEQTLRKGAHTFCAGAATLPPGALTFPQAARTFPMGTLTFPRGALTFPPGAITFSKGALTFSLLRRTSFLRKSPNINN